jgi:antitoxin CcdA
MRMNRPLRASLPPYDLDAPKRPANVTVNSDLLRRAREYEVNLSRTLESALAQEVAARARQRWLDENRAAIKGYNYEIESSGCFADSLRGF